MKEYIEREAALAFTKPEEWGTPDERWRPESEFGEFINALPAADVKPVVKGKWKYRNEGVWNCSECDYFMGWRPHFCPNCGATMDESEE